MQTPEFKSFLLQNGELEAADLEHQESESLNSQNEGKGEEVITEVKIPLSEIQISKHLGQMQFGTQDELKNLFPEVRNLVQSDELIQQYLQSHSKIKKISSFSSSKVCEKYIITSFKEHCALLGEELSRELCPACYYRVDFTEFQTCSFQKLTQKQLMNNLTLMKLEESQDPKDQVSKVLRVLEQAAYQRELASLIYSNQLIEIVIPFVQERFDQLATSDIVPLASEALAPSPPSVYILYILAKAMQRSNDFTGQGKVKQKRRKNQKISKILHALLLNRLNQLCKPLVPLLTTGELSALLSDDNIGRSIIEIVRILTSVVGSELYLTMTQIAAGVPILLYSILIVIAEACDSQQKQEQLFTENSQISTLIIHSIRYFHNLFDGYGVDQVDQELRYFLYKFQKIKMLKYLVPEIDYLLERFPVLKTEEGCHIDKCLVGRKIEDQILSMNEICGKHKEDKIFDMEDQDLDCSLLGRINRCGFCNTRGNNLKLCARCKLISYCGKDCQRGDYAVHKKQCLSLSKS